MPQSYPGTFKANNSFRIQTWWIESLLSKSELEKEIKEVLDVMALVVVEETESVKEILQAVEPILKEFADVVHNDIQYGLLPMRDIQYQIDLLPGLVLPNELA